MAKRHYKRTWKRADGGYCTVRRSAIPRGGREGAYKWVAELRMYFKDGRPAAVEFSRTYRGAVKLCQSLQRKR